MTANSLLSIIKDAKIKGFITLYLRTTLNQDTLIFSITNIVGTNSNFLVVENNNKVEYYDCGTIRYIGFDKD